jgi:uncharacterized protein
LGRVSEDYRRKFTLAKISRHIHSALLFWKNSPDRKVLLVRGARQVGKTYSLRELGRTFPHFLEINFSESAFAKGFFDPNDLNPELVLSKLKAYYNIPIEDGQTLLFFDEIQECQTAISALRFFHEKRPKLHVAAAGSLLDFAIRELPSFGVGRIQSLFMHPVTFLEFLEASEHAGLAAALRRTGPGDKQFGVFHHELIRTFRSFLCCGGLPEVVSGYLQDKDLQAAARKIETIKVGLEDDFSKYRGKVPEARLREVLRSAALQAGKKFVHKHAYPDANSQQVQAALGLLNYAGLVHKVYHANCGGIPLGAGVDAKKFKTIPFDHGLYQRLMGITPAELVLAGDSELTNKGALAEVFCAVELAGYSSPLSPAELYYWHRESKSSNAEVDFVVQVGSRIVPIEVKSGVRGGMKSLHLFLQEKKHPLGVRVSMEPFSRVGDVLVVPLYGISQLERLITEQ